MGSQATAGQDVSDVPRQLPRMRRPGQRGAAMLPEALGRAVNRTNRLDALTAELRAAGRQGRTSAWLAERLGVSARTVKRDVTALQQAGVPIRASSGPQGGYVIDQDVAQQSLALSTDEAVAIIVGLQSDPDQPFAAAAHSAISNVLRALSQEQRAEVVRVAGRVWIRPGEPCAEPDAEVRGALVRATEQHRVVLLDYAPGEAPPVATRQVEPLGFAHSQGHWFALGWCREIDAGRWFRLDGIKAVQPTHETFEPRDVRESFGSVTTEE